MIKKLLYIEDDLIDILAIKRVIANGNIDLTTVASFQELEQVDLSEFDAILSDSNLPDANLEKLNSFFDGRSNVHFISGSEVLDAEVILKPITEEKLKSIFDNSVINMKYIEDLADGDEAYKKEMIEVALSVLPDRMNSIRVGASDLSSLKKAAHKTKSSYRVCGMNPRFLNSLESLDEDMFEDTDKINSIIANIEQEISLAILELKDIGTYKA